MAKSKKHNGALQLSLMLVVSILAMVVSVYRSTLTAANFGAGVELDAYHFADNLSTFFLLFISIGITTVLVPAYVLKKDERAVNTFITVIFSAVAILIFLMFIGRSVLVRVLTDREELFQEYVHSVLGLTIIIQFLPAMLGVTAAFYQTEDRINVPKIILLITNAGIVIALSFIRNFTIYQYLWILLLGTVVQFILDIVLAVRLGFRFFPCFDIHNEDFRGMMRVFFPTLFSNGIYKINTMIDSVLSSGMGVGMLTRLSYANIMVGMANALFIGNLSNYSYPKVIAAIKESEKSGQICLAQYTEIFHAFICLLAAGFITIGRDFIALFYEHGKFTAFDTKVVYLCVCIYIFGQQNIIVRDLFYRYFYAHGDTKITMKNSLVVSVVNIVISIVLSRFIGIYGLVIGTVISGIYSVVTIILKFKKRYGLLFPFKDFSLDLGEDIVLLAATAVIVLLIKTRFSFGHFIDVLIFGTLTVLLYGAGFVLLKRRKLKELWNTLKHI